MGGTALSVDVEHNFTILLFFEKMKYEILSKPSNIFE